MAFFRFNRDKRGYEHFYLVEPVPNRRGKSSRPRVLYWYRTPPNIRVGRPPFDEEVRRELEAQNPGVTFDWRTILEAPIPSADADKWRERRRADRAARQMVADEPADGDADREQVPEIAAADAGAAISVTPDAGGAIHTRRRRRRRGRGESHPRSAPPSADPPSEPGDVPAPREPGESSGD